MKCLLFLFLTFFDLLAVDAWNLPSASGPQALAGGKSQCMRKDLFAAYNHPGMLTETGSNSIAIAYQSQFLIQGLNSYSIAAHKIHKNKFHFGLAAGVFGNMYYNESLLKLSFASHLGKRISAGIGMSYLRLRLTDLKYTKIQKLIPDLGMLLKISPVLDASIRVFNPFVYDRSFGQSAPTCSVNAALLFKFNSEIGAVLEYDLSPGKQSALIVNLQYRNTGGILLIAGFHSNPGSFGLGLKYSLKNLHCAFSTLSHPYLRNTVSGCIAYSKASN
ncbi:MAG: hypothetical protein H6605_03365 [Flavobacteriales bacterium]|nr:hypothetical protein [Flavobacteriales bacterium]